MKSRHPAGGSSPATPLEAASEATLPPRLREAWQRSMELRGDATLFEVFGLRPDLYDWYIDNFYGQLFFGGKVARRTKELVRLRLSQRHGCRFCNQGNRVSALDAGISAETLQQLEDGDQNALSDGEQAALLLADQLALDNPDGTLSPQLHSELAKHYSDGEILELGMVIAVLCGMAKLMFAFDLVQREDNCPFHPGERQPPA